MLDDDDPVFDYLPDRGDNKRPCNRKFAYAIFSSLHPIEAKEILAHAVNLRQVKVQKFAHSNIDEEKMNLLLSMPRLSVSQSITN